MKLPQTEEEFHQYINSCIPVAIIACANCGLEFSSANVYTPEGWVKTQTRGFCEECYEDIIDNICGDDE